MLGKSRKTKAAFEKKKICDAIVVRFFFSSCLLRLIEAPVLRLGYTVQHFLIESEFHDY